MLRHAYINEQSRHADKDKTPNLLRRMLQISVPVAASAYVTSGLRTLQQLLIPAGLRRSGATAQAALGVYGTIQGHGYPPGHVSRRLYLCRHRSHRSGAGRDARLSATTCVSITSSSHGCLTWGPWLHYLLWAFFPLLPPFGPPDLQGAAKPASTCVSWRRWSWLFTWTALSTPCSRELASRVNSAPWDLTFSSPASAQSCSMSCSRVTCRRRLYFYHLCGTDAQFYPQPVPPP